MLPPGEEGSRGNGRCSPQTSAALPWDVFPLQQEHLKAFSFFPLILVWKYWTIPHCYFFIDILDLSSLWNSTGCEMLQLGSRSMWGINTKPSLFLILFLPTASHHSGPNLWIFILRTRAAVGSRCAAWEPRFPSGANPLRPWSEQSPSG